MTDPTTRAAWRAVVSELTEENARLRTGSQDAEDLEMFTWLVHATVKYDNIDLSRPEPNAAGELGLYGIGLGDPSETRVEWHYGETLREAIRTAMRSELP